MSQHTLYLEKVRPLGKLFRVRMVVGWDGPLGSFFADVFDDSVTVKNDDSNYDDWHLVEIGLTTGVDIHYAEDLQGQLAEAGYEMPDRLMLQLEMDKLARGSVRYPMQQAGLEKLGYDN